MKSSDRNDGWILGRIYFNPEDNSVIVKRPHGGYTMNFGNKQTWIFSIVVVMIIILCVIVL